VRFLKSNLAKLDKLRSNTLNGCRYISRRIAVNFPSTPFADFSLRFEVFFCLKRFFRQQVFSNSKQIRKMSRFVLSLDSEAWMRIEEPVNVSIFRSFAGCFFFSFQIHTNKIHWIWSSNIFPHPGFNISRFGLSVWFFFGHFFKGLSMLFYVVYNLRDISAGCIFSYKAFFLTSIVSNISSSRSQAKDTWSHLGTEFFKERLNPGGSDISRHLFSDSFRDSTLFWYSLNY